MKSLEKKLARIAKSLGFRQEKEYPLRTKESERGRIGKHEEKQERFTLHRKNGGFAGDISTVGWAQIISLSSCRNPAVILSHPARAERILVAVCDGSVEDSKIIRDEQDV